MKNLVIFDLDGTLIDSLVDLTGSVNHTLKLLGQPEVSDEYVKNSIGDGARKLLERCSPALSADEIDQAVDIFLPHYDAHCVVNTKLYKGVKEWLIALKNKGVKIALLTNKPEVPSRHILEALEIDSFFDLVIGGDTLAEKKPSPLGIQTIMKELRSTPAQSLMVGDGTPDIESAKACNVESIAILNGIGYRENLLKLDPDYTVEHFEEIPSLSEIVYGSSYEL